MGLKITDFMGLIPAALGRAGVFDYGTKGLGVGTTTTRTTGGLKKGGKVAKAKTKGTPKRRKGFKGKGAGAALRGF